MYVHLGLHKEGATPGDRKPWRGDKGEKEGKMKRKLFGKVAIKVEMHAKEKEEKIFGFQRSKNTEKRQERRGGGCGRSGPRPVPRRSPDPSEAPEID